MTLNRARDALLFRLRRGRDRALDAIDSARGRRDPLTPPRRMLTGDYSDFARIGNEFLDLFIRLGGLQPSDSVLDIGCGPGRMAAPLTGYLSSSAEYAGFDLVGEEVRWCQAHITPLFPNFRFERVDVHNARYNPRGTVEASQFRFPYPDGAFDFAFATSVLTHMLAADVDQYLDEVARVLRRSGRALLTWFLLTDESRAALPTERFSFAHPVGPAFVNDPSSQEAAVAYPEQWAADRIDASGLRLISRHPGGWCGHAGAETWQDVLVVGRA